jgi:hypothetical protein
MSVLSILLAMSERVRKTETVKQEEHINLSVVVLCKKIVKSTLIQDSERFTGVKFISTAFSFELFSMFGFVNKYFLLRDC